MDCKITKGLKATKLSDIGVIAKDFIVSSIELEADDDKVEGRDGYFDNGASFGQRTIVVPFYFKAHDLLDVPLLRDELFRLVSDKKPFYVQEMRRKKAANYSFTKPNEAPVDSSEEHESFRKRYKVRLVNIVEIEQSLSYGEGELVFVSVGSPFAESEGTTLDPLTFTAEKWQVGQGLTLEEPKYAHNTTAFRIFNAGDVAVDPRDMPLEIIYRGKSNGLEIKNNTTSDVWKYNGTSSDTENIFLSGIRSSKNNQSSIFKDTNKKLITLAPGWNDFTLSGTIGTFLISFEHRFYYY